MKTAGTSATIVKEEILKTLAAELGFILFPRIAHLLHFSQESFRESHDWGAIELVEVVAVPPNKWSR